MQTSGLLLDVYDDFSGETLRALYPSREDIPDGVKQAFCAMGADRASLPDDVFALVLVNNGEKLRKYACVDEGNTVLSVQYFLKHAHKLPLEAQKVAAENLVAACSWYDFEPPEDLQKIALGLGTAMTALTAVPIIKGTTQSIKENLAATRAGEAAGAGIVTPQMRNQMLGKHASALVEALAEKTAEISGTQLAPNQEPGSLKVTAQKSVIPKTAGMGHLVPGHKGEAGNFGPEETEKYDGYTKGKTPNRFPQTHLRPTVDVSDKKASAPTTTRKVAHYAVPSQQKYPLDSYVHVKQASAYFDSYFKHMSPPLRREFAENLVKRASVLAIEVSDVAQKYGASDFAPEHEIKAAFDARRLELAHQPEALAVLDGVERVARFRMWKEADEKVASTTSPDFVVELLSQFDRAAGLDRCYDRSVPDPFYSIFGQEKTAESEGCWSDIIGNEMVTEEALCRLAKVGGQTLKHTFDMDFQKEFRKDPVGIYKSLPLDQKKMLMRLANATAPDNEHTV